MLLTDLVEIVTHTPAPSSDGTVCLRVGSTVVYIPRTTGLSVRSADGEVEGSRP